MWSRCCSRLQQYAQSEARDRVKARIDDFSSEMEMTSGRSLRGTFRKKRNVQKTVEIQQEQTGYVRPRPISI